jgi:hypothetical protein
MNERNQGVSLHFGPVSEALQSNQLNFGLLCKGFAPQCSELETSVELGVQE